MYEEITNKGPILTLSGWPSMLDISAEESFRKAFGIDLSEIFVVIFRCGILFDQVGIERMKNCKFNESTMMFFRDLRSDFHSNVLCCFTFIIII